MEIILIFLLLCVLADIVLPIIIKKQRGQKYQNKKSRKKEDKIARKGRIGEQLIRKRLSVFVKDGAKILYNCYIPNDKDGTSEIDVLMICRKGIWVIESKNYSGWIFGKASDYMWTQTLKGKNRKSKKNTFYNPIAQNRGHIKYLKKYLEMDIPFVSLVVFSDRCVFKSLENNTDEAEVIHLNSLQYCILKKMENMEDVLTQDVVDQLGEKLYLTTQVSQEVKKNHVQDIVDKKYMEKVNMADESGSIADVENDSNEKEERLDVELQESALLTEEVLQKEPLEEEALQEKVLQEEDLSENILPEESEQTEDITEKYAVEEQTEKKVSEEKYIEEKQAEERPAEEIPTKSVDALQSGMRSIGHKELYRQAAQSEKKATAKNMRITYCPQCRATLVPRTIEVNGEKKQVLECYRYPKCKYRKMLDEE